MRILIVEDSDELRGAISRRLRAEGHAADSVASGEGADEYVALHDYNAIILDRGLPDGDAAVRLRAWRAHDIRTPVLFLTARDTVEDRVQGFESGADDYLIKPFAMKELLARVSAIARRGPATVPHVVRVGDLEVDLGRREARRAGVLLPLRPKEFSLLELLASQARRVVSRSTIVETCWDLANEPMSNVEEVLVASLRRKLGQPSLIRTVRGAGYMLEEATDGE